MALCASARSFGATRRSGDKKISGAIYGFEPVAVLWRPAPVEVASPALVPKQLIDPPGHGGVLPIAFLGVARSLTLQLGLQLLADGGKVRLGGLTCLRAWPGLSGESAFQLLLTPFRGQRPTHAGLRRSFQVFMDGALSQSSSYARSAVG
jgi:hypothetical protein